MNELDKFKISKFILEPLKSEISLFHVFNCHGGINIVFKTKNDIVFGLGSNHGGILGLGHYECVSDPVHIPELSGKSIIEFINATSYMLARSEDKIYIWSSFMDTLFPYARAEKTNPPNKPAEFEFIDNLDIKDICCGLSHIMFLSRNGKVYTCGSNHYGQLGCGISPGDNYKFVTKPKFNSDEPILTYRKPQLIKLKDKITNIYCGYDYSFALNEEGRVYSWGLNLEGCIGHQTESGADRDIVPTPKLIKFEDDVKITSICCANTITYFLTSDQDIYYCGVHMPGNERIYSRTKQCTPVKIQSSFKFDSFSSPWYCKPNIINSTCCTMSNDEVFHLEYNKIIPTSFNCYLDYYSEALQITHKTIHLEKDQISKRVIQLKNNDGKKLFENRFREQYQHLGRIGKGGFGTIVKVKDKFDDQPYCIKIIKVENFAKQLKELRATAMANKDKSPKTYFYWLQEITLLRRTGNENILEVIKRKKKEYLFYIKMEGCDDNLANVLANRERIFNRKKEEALGLLEIIFSYKVFLEVADCIRFIHISGIIHRDIKLDNFLVKYIDNDHVVIKLADFGISTFHADSDDRSESTASGFEWQEMRSSTHTTDIGTISYIAPAIKTGGEYTMKADIYSLGLISKQIFQLEFNFVENTKKITKRYKGKDSAPLVNEALEMIKSMLNKENNKRPSSNNLVDEITATLYVFLHYYRKLERIDQDTEALKFHSSNLIGELGEKAEFFYRILNGLTKFKNEISLYSRDNKELSNLDYFINTKFEKMKDLAYF